MAGKTGTIKNFMPRPVAFKAAQYLVDHKNWASKAPFSEIAERINDQFGAKCTAKNAQGLCDMAGIERFVEKKRDLQDDIRFLARCFQSIPNFKLPPDDAFRLLELTK